MMKKEKRVRRTSSIATRWFTNPPAALSTSHCAGVLTSPLLTASLAACRLVPPSLTTLRTSGLSFSLSLSRSFSLPFSEGAVQAAR